MSSEAPKHTPGPWSYVPSNEHHGPYVTSDFGNTICDCYVMNQPSFPSTRNGGPSKPVLFMHEMADPNARLIAAAPEMYEALKAVVHAYENGGMIDPINRAIAAIAKADGRA